MFTHSSRKKRFSLLLLQEDEYYFNDVSAYYYPPAETDKEANIKKAKGRLKICSASLIFEPEDISLPITRFPMSHMARISEWVPPSTSPLSGVKDILLISTKMVATMKENYVNAPYKFLKFDQPTHHRFSLNYTSIVAFYTRVENLLRINSLDVRVRDRELEAVVREYEKGVLFDPSWMETLDETTAVETRAVRVKPLVHHPGRFILTNVMMYFQPFSKVSTKPVKKYRLKKLQRLIKRRHMQRHVALEFFLEGNSSFLLAFQDTATRDRVYEAIVNMTGMEYLQNNDQSNMLLKWVNGLVSNYDYLMYLNSLADRTCNDLTQYPVFPWIVADYESPNLDLTKESTFRDLSKPIGALEPNRLRLFQERYKEMPDTEPKFLYGSHYSTPGYVLYYLVRKAPEYMLRLQNGRFDAPDRLFDSVSDAWRSVLSNTSDVKELIPEFYQPPGDFLINSEGLDLGQTQRGRKVNDVTLPPWAKSPREFTEKCLQALESDHVSARLHLWINLIFGYQQRGEDALKANNLFYYLTYEGAVDMDAITDPVVRRGLEAQINEFGQTPKQLFIHPHPKRYSQYELPKQIFARDASPIVKKVLPVSSRLVEEIPPENPEVEEERHLERFSEMGATSPSVPTWPDLSTLHSDFSLKLHKDVVSAVCLSADTQTLYSVSQDSSLKIYNISEKRQLRSMNIGDLALSSCTLASDGKIVYAGSWDNSIYVYSVDYGRVLQQLSAHDDAVAEVRMVGNRMISCSWDSTVKIWKKKSGAEVDPVPVSEFLDHETEVKCMDVSVDESLAVSGASDGSIVVFDLKTSKFVRKIHAHTEPVTGIRITPDSTKIITCSSDGTIKMFGIGGTEVLSIDTQEIATCIVTDGQVLVAGCQDGKLRAWDIRHGDEIGCFAGSSSPITCIAAGLTEDSLCIVTGCEDGSFRVWRP
eukprot:TRINITY_DN7258_c0_g1_i1.p1 TRINITY_DN7258_c0_g1~~TRINITY_DN7258_c0_g1_i1.p1  ORF type:complete len:928 (-),score=199.57 TRINITY_DN7258_c0_g1_i1:277-3060(-)